MFYLIISIFSCKKDEILIATGIVSEVYSSTAYVTGYFSSSGEGIKKYGHCLSTDSVPTILNMKTEYGSTIGMGEFTSVFYMLERETQYHVRAYILSGNTILYGNEITFMTTGSIGGK